MAGGRASAARRVRVPHRVTGDLPDSRLLSAVGGIVVAVQPCEPVEFRRATKVWISVEQVTDQRCALEIDARVRAAGANELMSKAAS